MIDILNSKPGDNSMHAITGSINNSFFNIEFAELSDENKNIVNSFFTAMPKNVGVIINNYPVDVEIKYFNSDINFIEGIAEVDYAITEHIALIDSFIQVISNFINT